MITDRGNMMSVREDIKVLDATLRDGGIVNDFKFSDEFVSDLYRANIEAGTDYMEFGYRADRDQFSPEKFGKWKFASDEDIKEIIGDKDENIKISVMADVGRCNFRRDIKDREESPVDMIRIATYINQMPEAIEMVNYAHERGYETSCNIMAVSRVQERDLLIACRMLAESPVDVVYVVDSYGALCPIQIRDIVDFYQEGLIAAGASDKTMGIHAHNNQQCGFANTIEAMAYGASFMDATVMGMGRGAGNCALENLLGFLKNPKYRINPILKFIEKYMIPMQEENLPWGYNMFYMISGITDQHPRSAIRATKEGGSAFQEFYNEMME